MYTASFGLDDADTTLELLRSVGFGHLITCADGIEATALPFVIDHSMTVVRAHVARANPQWRSLDGAAAMLLVPIAAAYVSPRWYPSKLEHGRVVPTSNYGVVHLHGTVTVRHEAEWKLDLVSDLTDLNEASIPNGNESGDDSGRKSGDGDLGGGSDEADEGRGAKRADAGDDRTGTGTGSGSGSGTGTRPGNESDVWSVSDAPSDFIDKQLKAIVGIELNIASVEAKLKLSQNREQPDRDGVAAGLTRSGEASVIQIAALMT